MAGRGAVSLAGVRGHASRARAVERRKGGTTFDFVTDGVESALAQAKAAAKGKDVRMSGCAETIREYLGAGPIEEFTLHIALVILGGGVRLFEGMSPATMKFEQTSVSSSALVTHVDYRVLR
jgi:dihydrofolate reductase